MIETAKPDACEDGRVASLLALKVLDTEPEPEFDAIVRLVSAFCATPMALLSLVDRKRQFFKARVGLDAIESAREGSFCDRAIGNPGVPFVVSDVRLDLRFGNHSLIAAEHIRFYAGVPLVTSGGDAIGTLCTLDRVPRELTPPQLQALVIAAETVMMLLEKRSEDAYLRLLELVNVRASDGIAIVGIGKAVFDSRIEYVNPAFSELTGYGAHDASGGRLGRTLMALSREAYDRGAFGVTETIGCDTTQMRKDGLPEQFAITLTAVAPARGSRVGYVVAVLQSTLAETAGAFAAQKRLNEKLEHDLQARKRAEAALRSSDELFSQVEQHAPIGLALVTLAGDFIRVNPALCRITNYGKETLTAMTYQMLLHPEDVAADAANVEAALSGASSSYESEQRYLLEDGRVVWVCLNCSLVRDQGEPSYFIRQIQDIGDRKASERELELARASALAAADAKSRFVAMMSHEIRTPMNGIIGMTELLGVSPLNEEQKECVGVVRDSGRSLLRVLDDILDYSKIEAGKLVLENVDFNLRRSIESVESLMRPQFAAKGVSLTLQIDDVVTDVQGDPGRFRQILLNLVGNALKFTPPGGKVGISATAGARSAATIPFLFTVRDSGPGIVPEARHRLFQPFSQAEESTTRTHGGTGLGLSICKQLVTLMGGAIGVDDAPTRGSAFWFSLRFTQGSGAAAAPNAPERALGGRGGAFARRSENVLLAEDNAINVLLAVKQFKRLGFDVTVVADGRAAVKAVVNRRFDAIFMDCHMPELDGFEATREIRKLPLDVADPTPIIAMTANAQAEDRERCLAAGMDDYVAKPVTLDALRDILARWIPVAGASPARHSALPN